MAFYFFDEYGKYVLVGFCIFYMVGGVLIICAGIWSTLISVSAAGFGVPLVLGLVIIFLFYLGYRGAVKSSTFKLKLFGGICTGFTFFALTDILLMLHDRHSLPVPILLNTVVQILCIVLAFGLASDINRKADSPQQCSCGSDNENKAVSPPKCSRQDLEGGCDTTVCHLVSATFESAWVY